MFSRTVSAVNRSRTVNAVLWTWGAETSSLNFLTAEYHENGLFSSIPDKLILQYRTFICKKNVSYNTRNWSFPLLIQRTLYTCLNHKAEICSRITACLENCSICGSIPSQLPDCLFDKIIILFFNSIHVYPLETMRYKSDEIETLLTSYVTIPFASFA